MGFLDEIKKLARPYAEDADDFDDGLDEQPAVSTRSTAPARERYTDSYDDSYTSSASRSSDRGAGKVVNIRTATQMQVVLVKPDRFDNVADIAEHLREKRAVVLNLETANKDVARRLVDFLSGCAYALDGKIKKIAVSTYIITPYNVDIVGDLIDELENSGLYL
ncbi:MAG: cell division protein SepF [Oscillospiraceae bacterium]|nr:cell division protein SepF [Oscillospiraceae bacterium]